MSAHDSSSIGIGLTRRVSSVSAAALGVSVALPLAAFPLARQVLFAGGTIGAWAFLIALVVLLPSFYLQSLFGRVGTRGSDTLSSATLLGVAPLTFAVGWLSFAGYAFSAALLLRTLGGLVSLSLSQVFDLSFFPQAPTVGLALFVLVKDMVPARAWWGARTWLVALAAVCLLGVFVWQVALLPGTAAAPTPLPSLDRPLAIVAVLACLGWAVDAIFSHAGQLKARKFGALGAGVFTMLLSAGGGALTLLLLRVSPDIFRQGVQLSFAWEASPSLVIGTTVAFLLGLEGLSRLTRGMQRIGATLTASAGEDEHQGWFKSTLLLVLALVGITCSALFVPPLALAASSGAAYLWATGLTCLPLVFFRARAGKLSAKVTLPLLRPAAAATLVLSLLLSATLPWDLTWGVPVWLVCGLVAYAGSASLRAGGVANDEDQLNAESNTLLEPQAVFGIITPGCDRVALCQATSFLARQAKHQGVLFDVVPFNEKLSPRQQSQLAHRRLRVLRKFVAGLPVENRDLEVVVQMGPGTAEVARDIAETSAMSLAVVSVGKGDDWAEEDLREVEQVCRAISAPTVLVHGKFTGAHRRTVVFRQGETPAPGLLELARTLTPDQRPLQLVCTERDEPDEEKPAPSERGEAALPEADETDRERESTPPVVFEGSERECWMELRSLPSNVLVVMRCATDSVLGRMTFGGKPLEEARLRPGPTVIFKTAEAPVGYLWRRLTEIASDLLPPIDDAERVVVLSAQGKAARPNRDFFFLMVVSSLIAIAGLLANSTAVVIGAMLVAPLMNPIVGLAMAVAVASEVRLRRSARAVTLGSLTAIFVATLTTMLFPIHKAPPEVMARVSPNLLDLIVAVAAGAAASYAAARKSVAGALPGVAIAVALVPPLCVVGFGLGSGSWAIAQGATLLFLTNLAAIVLVSASIFMLFGFRPIRNERSRSVRVGLAVALSGLMLISIPLAIATFGSFESRLIEWRLAQATPQLEAEMQVVVDDFSVQVLDRRFTAQVRLLVEQPLLETQIQTLKKRLPELARHQLDVHITAVRAQVF